LWENQLEDDDRRRWILAVLFRGGLISLMIGAGTGSDAVADIATLLLIGSFARAGHLRRLDGAGWFRTGGAYRPVRRAGGDWRRLQQEWRG